MWSPRWRFSFCAGTADSQAAAGLPAFLSCANTLQIRPTQIQVACGDGNFYLTKVRWSHWTATSAVGHQNDCKPYCAAGHFHRYQVELRLWRPELCTGSRHLFTRFYVHFVGAKPSNSVRSYTLKVPFYTGRGCP